MRLLCIALILIATTALAQDSIKISGRILDPLSDSIEVSYNTNKIAYYPVEYFARLDKKGNFSLSLPVPHGVYTEAAIKHGNKFAELIIQPGDSLVINAIGAHFDSLIHYYGRGSAIENFIALHDKERGLRNKYTVTIREHLHEEPADFLKSIAQEKKAELDFLNKNKAGLPASFIKYWEAYYQYYNYFFIQQYPQIHEFVKLRRYTDTVPEINYSVVKEMPYAFNDSLMQLPPYLLYLTGVFDIKMKAAGYTYFPADTVKARRFQDSVYTLVYKQLPDKSAEYYIAQDIYGRAKNQQIERTEKHFDTFKKHWPQSEYLPMLEKQVATAERLAPGQPAPDFNIITADGTSRKLSDLRGKVVYLNFWASWCKQCLGEITNERKIKTLVKNEPLEFVYVSIDNDTAVDNAIIRKYKISGLFTHADGGWNAKEVQQYGVQGLPAYFLIDKDGKIAVQNALTPMQPTELVLQIEQLMK
jgi:peroxiredoxin